MDVDDPDHDPADVFTQTFLLGGEADLPTLQAIWGPDAETRKKRAHRKSRWGCTACKRRKVKCDENAPCSNCTKRRETCSLVDTSSSLTPSARRNVTGNWFATPVASPQPLQRTLELDPLPNADARVNLLHMELFHHFTQVTIHTLTSDLWTDLVLEASFRREYFMTAMLAVAARHLSILNPSSRRHSDAALLLLSKSCAQFRADLDQAITVENRDARLGTALLLHYLGWCNLSFLEFQTASPPEPLDLSGDQLFLLSEGLRHVRFLSWELPDPGDSIFGRFMKNSKWARRCGALKSLLEERGVSARPLRNRIMDLFDDPRFAGTQRGGVPTPPPEGSWQQQQHNHSDDVHPFGTAAGAPPPCPHACSDAHILSMIALKIPRKNQNEQTPEERELYTRLSFEIVADRLSIMLHICRLYELGLCEGSAPGVSAILGTPVHDEIERCFLAFPILCYRPFCNLVVEGDSRALAVLYHLYRSARVLLGGPRGVWWAVGRSEAMEAALGRELKRRGLLEALRDMNLGPVD